MADDINEVTMPKLGESVTEGTLSRWLKQVGEPVAFDDPLFEVSTDKVDSEIPSPYDGVLLEVLVTPGETVAVGTPLARIGPEGAEMPVEESVAPPAADMGAPPSTTPPAGSAPAGSTPAGSAPAGSAAAGTTGSPASAGAPASAGSGGSAAPVGVLHEI